MDERRDASKEQNQEYERLALLEELESLLEDLEDGGIIGLYSGQAVPDELRRRMDQVGARDVQQVRDKIMHIHAELDQDESDLTISDS